MALTKATYSMIDGAPAVNVKDFGAVGNGVTDDAAAITAADNYASSIRAPVFFPPGSYRIKSTVVRKAQSAWFGPAQQSNQNINNEVELFGTVEDIGDGNPMIRCAAVGVTTSVQSISFENLQFVSNKTVTSSSLSTTTSNGITLVDVSNVKEGLEFIGCSFKRAAYGIRQSDGDPYLDKTTLDRCHFTALYRAIQCNPTAGLSLTNCFVYDCFDWINTKGIASTRAAGADVYLSACSFNNSSFSSNNCGITAAGIVAKSCWFEGGNRWFYATKFASAEGCYFSEAFASTATGKFSMAPNDPDNNACVFYLIGTRIATNTRVFDLSNVVDKSTISITMVGCYNGSNFSDSALIGPQLAAGIDYEGYANASSASWNVSQHNRKMAIGTKREPEYQVDIQNNGAGSGVYLRITDTAAPSNTPKTGVIFSNDRTSGPDNYDDVRLENNAGNLIVASSTDSGSTWTNIARITKDGALGIADGISEPNAIVGTALIYVDSADGDLKVRFGDGTIKTLATDT